MARLDVPTSLPPEESRIPGSKSVVFLIADMFLRSMHIQVRIQLT